MGGREVTKKCKFFTIIADILGKTDPHVKYNCLEENTGKMAAAQVAKKLKDKRQKRTIEGIFRKVILIVTTKYQA